LKRLAAIVATLALLIGSIYFGRHGGIPRDDAANSPEACLNRMFRAAEAGDVASYLDCFTGTQRERLARDSQSQSDGVFASSLKNAMSGLKGRAIRGPGVVKNADAATLVVERIYDQHTERQAYHFRHEADGCRIDSLGAVEKRQPSIPYGTPVFEPREKVESE
jgi:hypothetical protein